MSARVSLSSYVDFVEQQTTLFSETRTPYAESRYFSAQSHLLHGILWIRPRGGLSRLSEAPKPSAMCTSQSAQGGEALTIPLSIGRFFRDVGDLLSK